MNTKQKGNIAELAVAADLVKRGFVVALPFGEYGDWDLLIDRHWAQWTGSAGRFERVQVKYAMKVNGYIPVRNRCHSVTAGRVTKTVRYNSTVEWLAVYEPTTDACYYVPNVWLAKEEMRLRLDTLKNGHVNGIKWAKDYLDTIELKAEHKAK
jgi:hypothetical protein